MYEQMTLFQPPEPPARAIYGGGIGQAPTLPGRKDWAHMEAIFLDRLLPLEDYDKIIVLFSGGKDSLACVLDLLERGVALAPRHRRRASHPENGLARDAELRPGRGGIPGHYPAGILAGQRLLG